MPRQPILMVEAAGKQWLSFNAREDHLNGLTVGQAAKVMRNGADAAATAVVTELRPLGVFAPWQAERVIGDHDRNTLRLRLDPQGEPAGLEPGMTVWIENQRERDVFMSACSGDRQLPRWRSTRVPDAVQRPSRRGAVIRRAFARPVGSAGPITISLQAMGPRSAAHHAGTAARRAASAARCERRPNSNSPCMLRREFSRLRMVSPLRPAAPPLPARSCRGSGRRPCRRSSWSRR